MGRHSLTIAANSPAIAAELGRHSLTIAANSPAIAGNRAWRGDIFCQNLRAGFAPVERQAFAGGCDFHDFVVEIEAGCAAEFGLVVASGDFEIAVFRKRRDIAALGLEASVGYAGGQDANESGVGAAAEHVAHRLLALRDEAAYYHVALVNGAFQPRNDCGDVGNFARDAQRNHRKRGVEQRDVADAFPIVADVEARRGERLLDAQTTWLAIHELPFQRVVINIAVGRGYLLARRAKPIMVALLPEDLVRHSLTIAACLTIATSSPAIAAGLGRAGWAVPNQPQNLRLFGRIVLEPANRLAKRFQRLGKPRLDANRKMHMIGHDDALEKQNARIQLWYRLDRLFHLLAKRRQNDAPSGDIAEKRSSRRSRYRDEKRRAFCIVPALKAAVSRDLPRHEPPPPPSRNASTSRLKLAIE